MARQNKNQELQAVDKVQPHAGFMFFCSEHTVQDCLNLKLLGAPKRLEREMANVVSINQRVVQQLTAVDGQGPQPTILLLFNFHKREMLGVFIAISDERALLRPDAFVDNRQCRRGKKSWGSSQFPVQLNVERVMKSSFVVQNDKERFDIGPITTDRLDDVLWRMGLKVQQVIQAAAAQFSRSSSKPQHTPHSSWAGLPTPILPTPKSELRGILLRAAAWQEAWQKAVQLTRYQECISSNLFAMREKQILAMQCSITPHSTPLFLFDFSRRKMHGVFIATSKPGLNLKPGAFSKGTDGETAFGAQVKVQKIAGKSYCVDKQDRFDPGSLSETATSQVMQKCTTNGVSRRVDESKTPINNTQSAAPRAAAAAVRRVSPEKMAVLSSESSNGADSSSGAEGNHKLLTGKYSLAAKKHTVSRMVVPSTTEQHQLAQPRVGVPAAMGSKYLSSVTTVPAPKVKNLVGVPSPSHHQHQQRQYKPQSKVSVSPIGSSDNTPTVMAVLSTIHPPEVPAIQLKAGSSPAPASAHPTPQPESKAAHGITPDLQAAAVVKGVRQEKHKDPEAVAFRVVMVNYIPVGSMKAEVQDLFSSAGAIEMLKLIVRPRQRFGYCFLRFKFAASAAMAISNFNQTDFRGSVLQVNYADKSVEQPGEDPWGQQVDQWAQAVEKEMPELGQQLGQQQQQQQQQQQRDQEASEMNDQGIRGLVARTARLGFLDNQARQQQCEEEQHQDGELDDRLLRERLGELSPSLAGSDPTSQLEASSMEDSLNQLESVEDGLDDELDDGAVAFLAAALSYVRDNPISHQALEEQMLLMHETNEQPALAAEVHQPISPGVAHALPTIVIDGANVARHHNRLESGFLNIKPIHTVLDHWLSQGHQCMALLPDFWFDPVRQARQETYQQSVMLLNMLHEMGLVAPIPEDQVVQSSKLKLEPPIIQYTKQHRGVIVTTETFADSVRAKPDKESRECLRAWVRMFTMPFTFSGASYVPQPDFVMPTQQIHQLLSSPAARIASPHQEDFQLSLDTASLGAFNLDRDELPSVAAFRRHAVLDVMRSICSVEHKEVKLSNDKRQNRFLTRKVAADVFNKWVFQTHATGNSPTPLMDPGDQEGWTRTHTPLDPVIPSCENSILKQYIERQLISGYEVTEEAATVAAAQLSAKCLNAAQRVRNFTKTQKRWWSKQVSTQATITDQSLRMSISYPGANKAASKKLVQITWKGSGDQQHEHCQLWQEHFEALKTKYLRGGHSPAQMLSRIFVMVLRYETLSEIKSAYQAALPKEVLQVMQDYFGVRCECFASPLNCYCDHYCSLFPDTDAYFGSRGSFFDYSPNMGSFECNPPFDQMSVLNTFMHILKLLHESEDLYQPLSFIVTTAQMDFNANFAHFQDEWNRFCTKVVQVPRVSHSYLMGLQHRQTGESRYWSPSRDSTLYFLQNPAGAAMWPATDDKIQLILDAWGEAET